MGVEPAQPNPAAAAATTAEQAQDLIDVSPSPKPPNLLHHRPIAELWFGVPLVPMRYCRLIWMLGSINLPGR